MYYKIRTRIDSEIIMKKYKKPLLIALVVLDVALIAFFLVVSIMVLAASVKYKDQAVNNTEGLIKAILELGRKSQVGSFFAFVAPMFILLAANIVGLMMFVRKTTKKEPAKISDLSEEQKEALRQELLRDLQGNKEEKKEE